MEITNNKNINEPSNYKELKMILKSKGNFEGLYHYTDFQNIGGILSDWTLLSRELASKRSFIDAANLSVLSHTEDSVKTYVRFFYKENTPTIYVNSGIKKDNAAPHMPIPVILVFSPEIMKHDGVMFLDGSGSSSSTHKTDECKVACGFNWDLIFSRCPLPKPGNNIGPVFGETNGVKINNHRNAEFNYPSRISIDYVTRIYFRSPADMKHFKVLYADKINVPCFVNVSKFPRRDGIDYLYDYDIKFYYNHLRIGLIFKTFAEGFKRELVVKFANDEENRYNLVSSDNYKNMRKLEIPESLPNYNYYLDIDIENRYPIKEITFYLNGFRSMIWRLK